MHRHNDAIRALNDLNYLRPSRVKYFSAQKDSEKFLRWRYKAAGITIKDSNFEFINDFECYLKSQKYPAENEISPINTYKILQQFPIPGKNLLMMPTHFIDFRKGNRFNFFSGWRQNIEYINSWLLIKISKDALQ